MWALANHVVDVAPVGAPYIGVRSWDGWWGHSLAWSLRRGSWSTRSRSSASSGVAERRRTPVELRKWAGRQKRRRRTVLAGWDREARLRAQQRGRAVQQGWAE